MSETARPYTPTALPSVLARWLAFIAIVVGGLCGGLIGWAVSDLQCGNGNPTVVLGAPAGPTTTTITTIVTTGDTGGCAAWNGGSGILGAVVGAGGTGVVAVLVLRAMAEWRRDLDVEDPPD